MQPEYPHWFNPGDDYQIVADETVIFTCEMLRGPMECGNDTYYLAVYKRGRSGSNAMAVCLDCAEEMGMSGQETIAYWRERQREWGVR